MVRWMVAGDVATRTFPSATLADDFRSKLIRAVNQGEAFDIATGLPESLLPREPDRAAVSWLSFCADYVAARWAGSAAKTRDSMTDSLATAAIAMTDNSASQPSPQQVRRAFLWYILPANKESPPPPELADTVRWLRWHCLPTRALAEPRVARQVLHRITLQLDGRPAAGDTWRRRRRGLNTAVQYAIERGELHENPLKRIKTGRVAATNEVDPRVVVNHVQARELLTAVSYVGS
jgi:hypothetical protein